MESGLPDANKLQFICVNIAKLRNIAYTCLFAGPGRHQPPWRSVSEIVQQSKQRSHPSGAKRQRASARRPTAVFAPANTQAQRPRGIRGAEPLGIIVRGLAKQSPQGATRIKPPLMRWLYRVVPTGLEPVTH